MGKSKSTSKLLNDTRSYNEENIVDVEELDRLNGYLVKHIRGEGQGNAKTVDR